MKHTLTVTGMTCEHCEKTIERTVHRLDRNAEVHADRHTNQVEITSQQSRELLVQAISAEGFTVV